MKNKEFLNQKEVDAYKNLYMQMINMKIYTINRDMKYVDEFINLHPLYFPDMMNFCQMVDEYVYIKLQGFIKEKKREEKLKKLLDEQ